MMKIKDSLSSFLYRVLQGVSVQSNRLSHYFSVPIEIDGISEETLNGLAKMAQEEDLTINQVVNRSLQDFCDLYDRDPQTALAIIERTQRSAGDLETGSTETSVRGEASSEV